ncbi:MAG: hypothetical protein Q9182_005272 [Xanthomendoza sp. 2 TL-2023]
MTDAPRVDLIYGHFGEPIYDPESRQWHYPRKSENAPRLRVLGQIRTLLSSELSHPTDHFGHTSSQRKQKIDQLIADYPELAPSSSLLPALAETSEAVQEAAAAYDQTSSDRLAYGRALHPSHHRNDSKTVPVVAVVGGAAGEAVRVIQLIPKIFSPDGADFHFQSNVLQSRVQGLWLGNGSPIQQLHFAESKGEPTEWLGVRYGGAVSILRISLREIEVPTLYKIPYVPVFDSDVEFRIEFEHIVTLPLPSGSVCYTDICFNPWTPLELAVLDQSCHWKIWQIKSVNKNVGVWTVENGPSGSLAKATPENGEIDLEQDGWGSLLFTDDGTGLLVCNRRTIVRFELREQPIIAFQMIKLGLNKSTDWILDIEQDFATSEHIFVTTSSRIFWIHLTSGYVEDTSRICCAILLAWAHFRNPEDVSLSTQIVSVRSRTIVLLYSRLTGLKTLYTLDPGGNFPSIDCDPFLLRVPGHDVFKDLHRSTLVLKAVQYTDNELHDRGESNSAHQKRSNWLLRCMVLHGDLSLHELFLDASSSEVNTVVEGPRSLGRARNPKSSYRVRDNFIIPNGLSEDDVQAGAVQTSSFKFQGDTKLSDVLSQDLLLSEDQWTLNFEWLAERIKSPSGPPLDKALMLVVGVVSGDYDLSDWGVISIAELIKGEVAVSDLDRDSTALQDFLRRVTNGQSVNHEAVYMQPAESISISSLTSPSLLPIAEGALTQVYDGLVESWIASLTATVPGRIRSRTERLIRHVGIQLQLASHGLRRYALTTQSERESDDNLVRGQFTFSLPVRQPPLVSSSSYTAASGRSPMYPASSQISKDASFMPAVTLPTPEPTPSLRSQGSSASVSESEDSATQRLRALSSIGSQPPSPSSATRILSRWSVGQDPDVYDWEASRRLDERDDSPAEAEDQRQRKRRKRVEKVFQVQDENLQGAASQPVTPRLVASLEEMPTQALPSIQPIPVTMSQLQPGRHGGSKIGKKAKKAGFR